MLTLYFQVYAFKHTDPQLPPQIELWSEDQQFELYVKPHRILLLFLFLIQKKELRLSEICTVVPEKLFVSAVKALNRAYKKACEENSLRQVCEYLIECSPATSQYSLNRNVIIQSDWQLVINDWQNGKLNEGRRTSLVTFFDTYQPLFASDNRWGAEMFRLDEEMRTGLSS